jgi:hypothetical protein
MDRAQSKRKLREDLTAELRSAVTFGTAPA